MATRKTVKKEEVKEAEKTEVKGRYFYAVGKRKTSIAQVRIYPVKKSEKGIIVNERTLENYFPVMRFHDAAKASLDSSGLEGSFDVTVKVAGGGISAQAEAVRLGIARALVKFDETLKKNLKDRGFLTRDARIVERKKPGLKKARRAPQWAKR
jgi:small subunit ribosomal protein S9